jgi:peptidoglycan/LPS O-acetylase OafA/YrhL
MLSGLRRLVLPSNPGAFRLWLAMLVVFHHVTRLEVGRAPVLVFFALSGYWVHRVWESRYSRLDRPWIVFVISRWWRIAPVMVIAAMASIATIALVDPAEWAKVAASGWRQVIASLTVAGYSQLSVSPVGPAWSLDIEMQFYLVAVVLIGCVRRFPALVALALAYATYTLCLLVVPMMILTSFLFPFVLGLVAARHEWRVAPRWAEAGHVAAIALAALAWASPWRHALIETANDNYAPVLNVVLAALLMPKALLSVGRRGDARDQIMADQSYVVYMLHWPAIIVLRAVDWPDTATWALAALGLGGVTAALCHVVHRHVDRPLNRRRAAWVASRRIAPAAAAAAPTKGDDSAPAFA